MASYPELVLRLSPRNVDSYTVEPQIERPNQPVNPDPDPGQATFDFDGLASALHDVAAYGALLTKNLFEDVQVRTAFEQMRTEADLGEVPLRLRLFIDPGAPELHALRWETLQDPRDGTALATGERILFSRYLRSPDWRSVQRRPKGDLRALVVIANPANLGEYAPEGAPLQALDVSRELALAEEALGPIQVTPLAGGGNATLSKLVEHLRGGYDILYLVCHGALFRNRPLLYLENDQGKIGRVDGGRLAEELGKLLAPPTLVVLASCQSAGSGGKGALAAVGPRLARAGIPAVLAMQGDITVETSRTFMSRFFKELRFDGHIERAAAVARGDVKDQPDAWMPVLFTRLKSGFVWSEPHLENGKEFGQWPVLVRYVEQGCCTPILGPGLIEFLLGSPRVVAQRWADTYRFPMSPYDREDLPQVAQYLAVSMKEPEFPRTELVKYVEQQMRERYRSQLPEALRDAGADELLTEVGRQRRERDETEPHGVLARMPLPIYITTNPDNLMGEALKAVGRDPQVELCRWKADVDWPPSIYEREPHYQPTPERPLVYHLFGQFRVRDSMVLTEDDYFEYLIGVTKNQDIIPPAIVRAWSDSALLFLGFQMDDWNFRVLFRSIMEQEGGFRRRKRAHVAVQIDPEEGRSLDPRRARDYLEAYFDEDDINIYWGTSNDFLRQLGERWKQRGLGSEGR